jgi:hypothetical protein
MTAPAPAIELAPAAAHCELVTNQPKVIYDLAHAWAAFRDDPGPPAITSTR